MIGSVTSGDWLALTEDALPVAEALSFVVTPECGAVGCFVGVVRDHADGLTEVSAIDYEAYEAQVVPRLADLAAEARRQWPEIGRVVLWHRHGRIPLGEASVAVVVSTPHRAESFDSCRYLIDTLKATLPIWKKEHSPSGATWSAAGRPVAPIEPGGA
jgi:molybdopterin synthase catalytic subunit